MPGVITARESEKDAPGPSLADGFEYQRGSTAFLFVVFRDNVFIDPRGGITPR